MRALAKKRFGFTLVEAMISMAILAVVGVTFAASMRSMAGLTAAGTTRADLQHEAAQALETILADLRMSGFVTLGGLDYPYVFDDGAAADGFEAHAHAVPPGVAQEGDYDAGVTREIVFVLPEDADADGLPDVDGGALAWGAEEFSYVLATDARGFAVLQRRVDGALDDVVAEGVERVVFDTQESSADFSVPLDAVRVRIYFRRPDAEGREVRAFVEGTTRLRNAWGDD